MVADEQQANELVAAALLRDVDVQEAGELDHIGESYDDVYGQVLPLADKPSRTLNLALQFWDCWADSAHHDWQYYDNLSSDDWPRMAREIAASLNRGAEVTDPALVERFGPRRRRSLRARLSASPSAACGHPLASVHVRPTPDRVSRRRPRP